jgi:hypothetical protein
VRNLMSNWVSNQTRPNRPTTLLISTSMTLLFRTPNNLNTSSNRNVQP